MDYSAEHHEARASSNTCCAGKKRIREQTDNKNHLNAKKGPKRSRVDEYPEPINPPPELAQRIGPTARPVFVYRKQLVEWDTQKGQNRLFINDRKKLMDFLTEEERRAVEDDKKPGIDLVGIDSMGREYKLHSNKWESLNIAVLNKEWHKIVVANGAKKGDWLHLWAFRRGDADDQLCLYVDFREQP
ncbi:putative B3 domain-containing protein at5g35780 [Phtheirospermum japonicum]|uniref:Putative B3 domain-containing protein at5g35780 n=1 Tax=Phtheirospermum japonicum TaxID=374723 RepID=A0A830DDC5_9LAMI|nr:putative B3 domain-containing protein at5g35780 [Phtheirospermum japonicum]